MEEGGRGRRRASASDNKGRAGEAITVGVPLGVLTVRSRPPEARGEGSRQAEATVNLARAASPPLRLGLLGWPAVSEIDGPW